MVIKDQVENQISCSKIRKAISRGRSIKYLVNDAVERYICLHNLYIIPDWWVFVTNFLHHRFTIILI